MKKLTTQEFIDKANKVHNNKYDYSKTNYFGSKVKVIIICKQHGEFLQTPNNHLKYGCYICGQKQLTTKQFIKKVTGIHGNRYDYSKTIYLNSRTKISIMCKRHGKFLQSPHKHLMGSGCPKCSIKEKKLSFASFIKKATKLHNNRYDYSKVNYINNKTKVIIICLKHGKFSQSPHSHLSGSGCIECAGLKKSTTYKFIKNSNRIHNNKYDYSKVKYKNNYTKVTIICLQHGKFLQSPDKHLSGQGCPKCAHIISKSETEWLDRIEQTQNIKIKRNPIIKINNKQFRPDGFHKPTNTWYEYNGHYWHGHPDYYNSKDIHPITKKTFGELYQQTLEKEKLIKSAGYNLISKWGD